jgi:tRNA(Ile)-lysidine synthase
VLKKFEDHIQKEQLFTKQDRLLVAISGGSDSVALVHLLKTAGYKPALAHCNFKLRGKDSDLDEQFCKHLAIELNLEIYTKRFNTREYCLQNKVNIQLGARQLRYEWFSELIHLHGFDCLITAHHANDVVETVLLNLLRGTGINGIKGIPDKNKKIRRPLLPFKKEEIEAYLKKEKIKFRLDKSNQEEKYDRNFLRINVVPQLKKLNPNLETTFFRNSVHFKQEAAIVAEYLSNRAVELITQNNDLLFINKTKLTKEAHIESVLNYILADYGFNESQQQNILLNILTDGLVGKVFHSPSHQLSIDRKDLILKVTGSEVMAEISIGSIAELKKQSLFRLSKEKKFKLPSAADFYVNESQLIYPLLVRPIKKGDKFKPFGMKGFKLLSDFLKDEKINRFEKENCKVLVNGNNEIMWLLGFRSDERYRVNESDSDLLKFSLGGE